MKTQILLPLFISILSLHITFHASAQMRSAPSTLILSGEEAARLKSMRSLPLGDAALAAKGYKRYSKTELKKHIRTDLTNLTTLTLDELKWKLKISPGSYMSVPLIFQSNVGQVKGGYDFVVQSPGFTAGVSSKSIAVLLGKIGVSTATLKNSTSVKKGTGGAPEMLLLTFKNCNSSPVAGRKKSTASVNSYIGNDKTKWHENIPSYSYVINENLYPGIKMITEARMGRICYSFMLAPQTKIKKIVIAVSGIKGLRIDQRGNLIMTGNAGKIVQTCPKFYEIAAGGRREVQGRFKILGPREYGFEVNKYDTKKSLLIDPEVVFTSYFGGGDRDAAIFDPGIADFRGTMDMEMDKQGNVTIAGTTRSPDFPITNSGAGPRGHTDVFTFQIDRTFHLVYSTLVGGSGWDMGNGVSSMNDTAVYVCGTSLNSLDPVSDFPTSPGVIRTAGLGPFVFRLSALGHFQIGSFISNDNGNDATCIVFKKSSTDPQGAVYVAGRSETGDTTRGTPGSLRDSFVGGAMDAFIAKLDPGLTAYTYYTYLGGSSSETIFDMDVKDGFAFVTGVTFSRNFPKTASAFQDHSDLFNPVCNTMPYSCGEAFISRLNRTGSALIYSTFFGRAGRHDEGNGIAVNDAFQIHITGKSKSLSNNSTDIFVEKFDSSGQLRIWEKIFAGTELDRGEEISVDQFNNVHVVGTISTPGFETGVNSTAFLGGTDIFYTKLNKDNGNPDFFTYIGGSGSDEAFAVVAAASSNDDWCAAVVGSTFSDDVTTINPLLAQGGNARKQSDDLLIYAVCNSSVPPEPNGSNFTKTAPASAITNESISYRLRVTNGTPIAVPVNVTDTIPNCIQVTNVLRTFSESCQSSNNVVSCTFLAQPGNNDITVFGLINSTCPCSIAGTPLTNKGTLQVGTHFFPQSAVTLVNCTTFCGNGVRDPREPCDGTPNCTPDCRIRVCGDGIVDSPETCEGVSANCVGCQKKLILGDPCVPNDLPCPPGTHCGTACSSTACADPINTIISLIGWAQTGTFNAVENDCGGDVLCDTYMTCIPD